MIERAAFVLVLLASSIALAGAPSAYQCAPGTAKNGVGCACPADHVERRDQENTAICVRRVITIKPARPTETGPASDGGLYDAIDLARVPSKETCTGIACARLAAKVRDGEGVAVDLEASTKFFGQACTAGHARSCYTLASHYDYGIGATIDKSKVPALRQRSCDLGYGSACFVIGLYEKDPAKVTALNDRARMLAETACKAGRADGCHDLAFLYSSGAGIPADGRKAIELYEQTCKDGYGESCQSLGFAYHFGKDGLAKDDKRAIEYYELACNTGGYHACSVLASLLRDPIQAGLGFAAGCRHGQGYGCWQLAKWFAGTDKSVLDRIKWKRPLTPALRDAKMIEAYTLACTYGAHNSACEELGERYLTGNGVAIDKAKARALFERSCAGNKSACNKARAK